MPRSLRCWQNQRQRSAVTEFCTFNNLCATDTYLDTKRSIRTPGDTFGPSTGTNILDVIVGRRSSACSSHAYQSPTMTQTTRWSAVRCACSPGNSTTQSRKEHQTQFVDFFTKDLYIAESGVSAAESWERLRTVIHRSAMATFRKKRTKTNDYFEAKSVQLTSVIESKRAALAEYKHQPSRGSLQIRRTARCKVQRTVRRCANGYWMELSEQNQTASCMRA